MKRTRGGMEEGPGVDCLLEVPSDATTCVQKDVT